MFRHLFHAPARPGIARARIRDRTDGAQYEDAEGELDILVHQKPSSPQHESQPQLGNPNGSSSNQQELITKTKGMMIDDGNYDPQCPLVHNGVVSNRPKNNTRVLNNVL